MQFLMSPAAFPLALLGIAIVSLANAPRRVSTESFFRGASADGAAPGLWTLVLSQVTTWIFARSLMNSAILGYFYGVAGALAYTAYYLSFLTGGFIVARARARGARSLQGWLIEDFGATGARTYNVVVGLRLLSEVFANLLVVGMIFSVAFPATESASIWSILVVGALALLYSAWGGLGASLRTDVAQMAVFLAVFAAAFLTMAFSPEFEFAAALSAEGVSGARPGWVLLAVALLQVFSYPAHDPVMMDRGFIADEKTTRKSFLHAFWLSSLCIFGFGLFGIQAGIVGAEYDGQLLGAWRGMFGPGVYLLIVVSLLVSALSTLDSALASAARLAVEELKIAPRTMNGGRLAMTAFALGGAALTLVESKTLFDAVAVSGTASMFLTPVVVGALVLRRRVQLWAYLTSFAAAVAGAAAYFFQSSDFVQTIAPGAHKYDQLLLISIAVLTIGFAAVAVGSEKRAPR